MLSVVTLNIVLLSVIMLNIVMLSVVAPPRTNALAYLGRKKFYNIDSIFSWCKIYHCLLFKD